MIIIRWQPFTELMSLRQAMDKLFEDSFVTPSRLLGTFVLGAAAPIDMYHTANDVMVKVALPGVKPEEVDITATDNTLNIKGEIKAKGVTKGKSNVTPESVALSVHVSSLYSSCITRAKISRNWFNILAVAPHITLPW